MDGAKFKFDKTIAVPCPGRHQEEKCRLDLDPCLPYQDAHAGINWLCQNFGFQKRTWVQATDAEGFYARVAHSGATVVQEIDDAPFGGRTFACRDPEGHVWHVGTWDAWASAAP